MVKKTIEPEEFEYDEIEDDEGNKKIIKRKRDFEFVFIEDENGSKRRIRKEIIPEEIDYDDLEDENGVRHLIKKKKGGKKTVKKCNRCASSAVSFLDWLYWRG